MAKLSVAQKIQNGEIKTATHKVNKLHQNEYYLELKTKVEKEYFKYIGVFVKYNDAEIKQVSFTETANSMKNIKFTVTITNTMTTKSGKTIDDDEDIEIDFFELWTEDPNILSYEKIVFEPSGNVNPKYFNLFTGFDWDKQKKDETVHQDLDIVIDHIKSLCGFNEEQFRYYTNWLAHIVQKPNKLTSTFCAFISGQGVGKDFHIDFLKTVFGQKYVHYTGQIDGVMGSFNQFLENKLLIGLDELEGADYKRYESLIKNLTTARTVDINKKNEKQYTINNYARLIFFSNGLQSIKCQIGDRRVNIFRPSSKYILLPQEEKFKYFDKLIQAYNNPDVQKAFYYHLKSLDIEGFDFTKQCKSEDQLHLEESNKPFIRQFIEYYFSDFENAKDREFKIEKGELSMLSRDLFRAYQSWLQENNFKDGNNSANFKLHMKVDYGFRVSASCGIDKARISVEDLKKLLEGKKVEKKYDNPFQKELDEKDIYIQELLAKIDKLQALQLPAQCSAPVVVDPLEFGIPQEIAQVVSVANLPDGLEEDSSDVEELPFLFEIKKSSKAVDTVRVKTVKKHKKHKADDFTLDILNDD